MTSPEQILDQVESDIATQLMGDPWFGQSRMIADGTYVSIPVITEDMGDVDTMTNIAVAQSGPGICIVVRCVDWAIQYKNVPGPYIEKMDVSILGIENVLMNRGTTGAPSPTGTLKRLKATMLRAQSLLHLWTPPCLTRALVCDRGRAVTVVTPEGVPATGLISYTATVTAAGGTGIDCPQVAQPILSVVGGTASLACATPGACICWSNDGRFPSPRTGTIYTAPFAVEAGQTIKSNAWLTYWTTSPTLTTTI
jgi:hypothetical protein